MRKIAADRNYARGWGPSENYEDWLRMTTPLSPDEAAIEEADTVIGGGKEWTVKHWINGNEYINDVFITAGSVEQIDQHKVRADHVLIDFGYSKIESVSPGKSLTS